MIDTIRFEIDLKPAVMDHIKTHLDSHMIVENKTGDVIQEFTRGTLKGSYDNRISVMFRKQRQVMVDRDNLPYIIRQKIYDGKTWTGEFINHVFHSSRAVPVLMDCNPFMIIEFSLPKWAEGVNFLNSTYREDFKRLVKFRKWLQDKWSVTLPRLTHWDITRLDIGVNFDIKKYSNVLEYFKAFVGVQYPRRTMKHYGDAIFFPGSVTATKLYSKYSEFKVHDYKRLKRFMEKERAKEILGLTRGIIRFEVGIKKRKLKDMGIKTIKDLKTKLLDKVMETELKRISNGVRNTKITKTSDFINTVMAADLVGKDINATSVISVWTVLTTDPMGMTAAKKAFGKVMVSRAIKVINELGLSTLSDLNVMKVPTALTQCNLYDLNSRVGDKKRVQFYRLLPKHLLELAA